MVVGRSVTRIQAIIVSHLNFANGTLVVIGEKYDNSEEVIEENVQRLKY